MIDKVVSTRIRGSRNPYGQASHDSRRKMPGYIEEPGVELVAGSMDKETIAAAIEGVERRYKEQYGKTMPRNANQLIEGIITFGTTREKEPGKGMSAEELEEFDKLDWEEMDKAAQKFLEWMETYHGTKSVYLVRHTSEKSPHYHFMIQNYNRHVGKTLTNSMTRADFADLQDVIGDIYSPMEIRRGVNKKVRSNDYRPVSEGHALQVQQLQQEAQKLMKRAEAYENRYNNRLRELEDQEKGLLEQAEIISRLGLDAKRHATALTKTLKYLDDDLKPQVVKAIEEIRDRSKTAKKLGEDIRETTSAADQDKKSNVDERRKELIERIQRMKEEREGPDLPGL